MLFKIKIYLISHSSLLIILIIGLGLFTWLERGLFVTFYNFLVGNISKIFIIFNNTSLKKYPTFLIIKNLPFIRKSSFFEEYLI